LHNLEISSFTAGDFRTAQEKNGTESVTAGEEYRRSLTENVRENIGRGKKSNIKSLYEDDLPQRPKGAGDMTFKRGKPRK